MPNVSLSPGTNPNFALAGVSSATTGLRSYSPELGRWVNRDPAEEAGGENLWGFVSNSPIEIFDYLGLSIIDYEVDNFGFHVHLGRPNPAYVVTYDAAEGTFSPEMKPNHVMPRNPSARADLKMRLSNANTVAKMRGKIAQDLKSKAIAAGARASAVKVDEGLARIQKG